MKRPLGPGNKADTRIQQQAHELQSLLARLMKPPSDQGLTPLPEIEMSPREFHVLMQLGERGRMTMTDLASLLHAPLSTLTRVMDRLEAKGLCRRFRSEEDRRVVVAEGSDKGKSLYNTIRNRQLDVAERMLRPLTIGEREILLELIAKLVAGDAESRP